MIVRLSCYSLFGQLFFVKGGVGVVRFWLRLHNPISNTSYIQHHNSYANFTLKIVLL